MAQCSSKTKAGKRCKAAAVKGDTRCLFHSNVMMNARSDKRGRFYRRK
jgi:hypothetical protein